MSELKTFLDTHKLDKQTNIIMLKEDARRIDYAFRVYGIKNYKYYPNNKFQPPEIKALFPKNMSHMDALIISHYSKESLEKIETLTRTDKTILLEEKADDEMLKEMLKSYV